MKMLGISPKRAPEGPINELYSSIDSDNGLALTSHQSKPGKTVFLIETAPWYFLVPDIHAVLVQMYFGQHF